jgi:hypothetical protein
MLFYKFILAVSKIWWAWMSCAIFTFIGFYVALTDKSNAWIVRGIFLTASGLLFWACFIAWKDKWEELEAEKLKSVFPDIRGEIQFAFCEAYTNPFSGQTSASDCNLYLKIKLVNHADVSCTVDRYVLLIHENGGEITESEKGDPSVFGSLEHHTNFLDPCTLTDPVEGSKTKISGMRIQAHSPLIRACAQEGWVRFRVKNYAPKLDQTDCSQEIFTLLITDSLGKKHEIAGPSITICAARFV